MQIYAALFFLFFLVFHIKAQFSNIQSVLMDDAPNANVFETDPFTKIGEKFYYIESINQRNWFRAAHACRKMQGHLAFIENASEMDALSAYLLKKGYGNNHWFWISGNDLGNERTFSSIATGLELSYSRWSYGQPDNAGGNENCVHLWLSRNEFRMNDWVCTKAAYFICQMSDPRTIAFTVW